MSLQSLSLLALARAHLGVQDREALGRGLADGVYLVFINSPTFSMCPILTRKENHFQEPELMLALLELAEAEGLPLGDWTQYVEMLWQEIFTPDEERSTDGWDDLVPQLWNKCQREPNRSKLQALANEVGSRRDFREDLITSPGIYWWPINSLPIRD